MNSKNMAYLLKSAITTDLVNKNLLEKLSSTCENNESEGLREFSHMKDILIYPLEDHLVWIDSLIELIERVKESIAEKANAIEIIASSKDGGYHLNNQLSEFDKRINQGFDGI
jgi:hypothetical protein